MNNTNDKKISAIGVLSISAVLLMLGNFFAPAPTQATTTIKDRDFSMVTAASQTGGDALYVVDNRSGRMAVYSYDPSSKILRPRAGRDVSDFMRATAR